MISIGWFAFGLLVAFLVGIFTAVLNSDLGRFYKTGYRKGYRDGKLGVPPEFPEKKF